jgi:Protein of unknown function (DUF3048) N-terminal domain/Protein of unknown function (DUF3048) C-terminal domain
VIGDLRVARAVGWGTVALITVGAALSACGDHRTSQTAPTTAGVRPASTARTATTVAATTTTVHQVARCPLTGQPAPGGKVPQRPALAVKVENLPAARPQYGLAAADVVYEEPVEAGITRFIVIYQCHDTSRIEPIRSGRLIDPEIVQQFGSHPLLAYAGAIQPAVAAIDASPLIDVGIDRAPINDYWRDPDRSAPHNLVSSTAVLYALGRAEHASPTPPPAVFSFGSLPAGAVRAAALHISYQYSNVTWSWQPSLKVWSRSYADTGPATRGEGGDISAANVVVLRVAMYPSPYVEDVNGAYENLLVLTGSGSAEVFRNGAAIPGEWVRPSLAQTTKLLDGHHRPIPLSPGPTWVELVPTTVPVAVSP